MPGLCGTLWRVREPSGLSGMETKEATERAMALRQAYGGRTEFASQGQKKEGHLG